MKIDIIDRDGYKSAARLKKVLTDKLNKLEKYFDADTSARVVCRKVAKQDKLEITISSKGAMYRVEVTTDNMYDNIDYALAKLEKQIVRTREKLKDRGKGRKTIKSLEPILPFEFLEEEPEELPSIFKKKSFTLEPMLIDDARFAIERLGHDFYVFLNAENGKVNVLYRRKDGKFGLLDLNY